MRSFINIFFDVVLVTNLDKRTDRMETLIPELDRFCIKAYKTKTFNGAELFPKLPKYNAGCIGTVLTHLNALRYAKQEGLKNILILEDDVRFSEKYINLLEQIVSELPNDWDMFYVGANDKHPDSKLYKYSEHLLKADKLFTTHAYSVNAKCFDVLINHLEKNIKAVLPIDVIYTQIQQSINCFMATPNLAWQQEGFSDMLDTVVNYDYMKPA